MSSIIWLDEPEGSPLHNVMVERMMDGRIIRPIHAFCPDRHIIAKGNILEGRLGR